MSPLLQQIARDPNLVSATVFGAGLVVVALVATLWLTLFQKDERRLRQRLERLQAGPRGVPSAPAATRPRSRACAATRATARSRAWIG
jgi:hypothetical protein